MQDDSNKGNQANRDDRGEFVATLRQRKLVDKLR